MAVLGVVRYWDERLRYGKIAADRRLWFVHESDVVAGLELVPELWIEFDPAERSRGPRAVNVRPCEVSVPTRSAR